MNTQSTRPRPALLDLQRLLADQAVTDALGAALARGLQRVATNDDAALVIFFKGELGAGKTSLIRALLRGLGVTGRIKSPTFTLVEPYEISLIPPNNIGVKLKRNLILYCYHFDFYRFTEPKEFLEAGFREYFDDKALCLVEWPERVLPAPGGGRLLPDADIEIHLHVDGFGRRVDLQAFSPRGVACLNAAVS
jgi:tRNA threonylcarbamoyladenosine biosynthesis protein TsaE